MAKYTIKIPDAAFLAGGPLFGRDEKSATVVIPLITEASKGPWFTVNVRNAVTIEDFDFHFQSNQLYQDFLQLMEKGLIEVYLVGGAKQAVTDINTLYKTFYQEL